MRRRPMTTAAAAAAGASLMSPALVIDRYINHSCAPNCMTEVVSVEKENKIIISACRRIQRGEEVVGAAP